MLVAVNLGIGQSAAETLFNNTDKVLVIDDVVWLPLSMSALNDGFMACWSEGADVINRAFNDGVFIEMIIVGDAWAIYPPAPLPLLDRNVVQTDNTAAVSAVNRVVQQYITQEINSIIRQVQSQSNSATQQNRLGILLVRSGRTAEAKAAYERAAGMGSVPAMTNRGNLALIENDFATAERWFGQALNRDPQNAAAMRGLNRIENR
jgi:tetratricopeptide (TPR) repeat protein